MYVLTECTLNSLHYWDLGWFRLLVRWLSFSSSEQDRLVENFITEACAVKKELLGNKSCDIHVTPAKLEIPMVPCNFIPVQPRLYKGENDEKDYATRNQPFPPLWLGTQGHLLTMVSVRVTKDTLSFVVNLPFMVPETKLTKLTLFTIWDHLRGSFWEGPQIRKKM